MDIDEEVTDDKFDPWGLNIKDTDDGPEWRSLTCGQRIVLVVKIVLKIFLIFGFLYLFICALGFLSDAFQLVGGRTAGKAFQDNKTLSNPVAGLMIGLLVTAILQSSSTTTSIVITMVGSEIIPIKTAIPMVMGANIGTSVTNTVVSFAQSGNREEFRRAFGGATVHDMFNWLTVIILLPLEAATHYLYYLTDAIVTSLDLSTSSQNKDLLKLATKPFTSLIVKVDKKVIKGIALKTEGAEKKSVLKRWCKYIDIPYNTTVQHHDIFNSSVIAHMYMFDIHQGPIQQDNSTNKTYIDWSTNETTTRRVFIDRCDNLFAQTDLSDEVIGILLMILSIILIVVSLILMVKVLNSLLKGSVAKLVKRFINSDFPGRLSFLTGYVAILFGTGMTMIIQSSSVFTSTLTPLVGIGVVSLERMYPLTLGANIGTCITGIMAALANPAKAIPNALQISLCHLFFNISGTILFYPVPFTRKVPITLAKGLGNVTAKYRWFSVVYLILMFMVLPVSVFALSLTGIIVFSVIGTIILFILFSIITLNICQRKFAMCLPKILRDWNFLPKFCHSLKPFDNLITIIFFCCKTESKEVETRAKGVDNAVFTVL